jgi:hypothetical protein
MKKPSIPPALIGVASGFLAEVYTHSDLDVLFMRKLAAAVEAVKFEGLRL